MEAQAIMADNIDKMTSNLEQAEDIEEKTSQLVDKADQFKKQSKSLKKDMCWRKWKLKIILIGIGLAIVAIIVIIILASVLPTTGGGEETPATPAPETPAALMA